MARGEADVKATKTKGRMCDRKRRHRTRQLAEEHMAQLVEAGAAEDALNVYECRHCGQWHTGHKPGNGRSR